MVLLTILIFFPQQRAQETNCGGKSYIAQFQKNIFQIWSRQRGIGADHVVRRRGRAAAKVARVVAGGRPRELRQVGGRLNNDLIH